VSALAKKVEGSTNQTAPWIDTLAYWFSATDQQLELGLRTTLSCARNDNNKTALFLPPEMGSNQPDNLHYLHRLASRHECRLIEDRRSIDIKPFIDRRENDVTPMMQASIELLKQSGMKGDNIKPSEPNRMNDDCIHIPLPELVAMAVRVAEDGKRIVVLPNPTIVKLLGDDTHPITGYAANIPVGRETITVAYYESPKYRCVGYRCGNQYINHVLLGGGPNHKPELWATEQTLVESNVRFQLYRSQRKEFDMGLLSVTQFIDL